MLPEDYEESEAPYADASQAVFATIFFVVWESDSFWLHVTTSYSQYIPSSIRNALFLVFTVAGGYMGWMAHEQIFGVAREEAELVDYGVYGLSRHPMYLGIMTVFLGLVVSTASVAAMVVLLGVFLFYHYLASYEEMKLVEFFGDRYVAYMARVRRWV